MHTTPYQVATKRLPAVPFAERQTQVTNTLDWSSLLLDEERKKRFARYVKTSRAAEGVDLTQDALAKAWGKSQSSVSDIERAIRIPDIDDIPALAAALKRPVAEVLQAAQFNTEPSSDEIVLQSGQRVRIVVREGDAGTVLDLDETSLAVLDALARSKQTAKKPV